MACRHSAAGNKLIAIERLALAPPAPVPPAPAPTPTPAAEASVAGRILSLSRDRITVAKDATQLSCHVSGELVSKLDGLSVGKYARISCRGGELVSVERL